MAFVFCINISVCKKKCGLKNLKYFIYLCFEIYFVLQRYSFFIFLTKFSQKATFIQRNLYLQGKFMHKSVCIIFLNIQKNTYTKFSYTPTFTHKNLYKHKLLHTEPFAQKRFVRPFLLKSLSVHRLLCVKISLYQ